VSSPSPILVLLAQVAGLALALLVLRRHARRSGHALVALAAAVLLAVVAVPALVTSAHGLRETHRASSQVTAYEGRTRCLLDAGAGDWVAIVSRLRAELPADARVALRSPRTPPLTCVAFTLLPRTVVDVAEEADFVVHAGDVPAAVRRAAAERAPGVRLLDPRLAVTEADR
jgi:hypothetical protein